MLVSDTAGYLRNKLGFVWRLRSLRAKTSLLALIFALVPVFLYAERQLLAGQGVLDRLAQSCRGEMPFSLLYDRPTGGAEIVTAVTPLLTATGCWAVVASFSAEAFPGANLGRPYWATPTVQIAAAI